MQCGEEEEETTPRPLSLRFEHEAGARGARGARGAAAADCSRKAAQATNPARPPNPFIQSFPNNLTHSLSLPPPPHTHTHSLPSTASLPLLGQGSTVAVAGHGVTLLELGP